MYGQKIVIVGAGAIGGCIGGLLCHSGVNVEIVARGEHGRSIREEGLNVKLPGRTISCQPLCVNSISEIHWRPNDVCLLATKLNDAEGLMNELLATAGQSVPIVCAFNGLQGEIWAAERFETVASIMVWMPATHLFPGDIRVYGESCPGVLDIGAIKGLDAPRICEFVSSILNSAGFDSELRQDILSWRYAKWITNLGNTAQAIITDDWKRVARAAQAEGEAVLAAAGIERIATNTLLQRCQHIRLEPIDGECRRGGSTWQSLQRGKALETKWIEGAMYDLAQRTGFAAPVCRQLAQLASERKSVSAAELFESVAK